MRVAILSDIHSNYEALQAVLAALDEFCPDRVVCLGDVVGYGASPNACCQTIREAAEVTLLGNHDAAVAGRMDYSFYYDAARHALDWTSAILEPHNREWLKGLPFSYRIGEAAFCHGSPVDPRAYEYIFALEQARELLPFLEDLPEVTFIGHSHLCRAYALGPGEVSDVLAERILLDRNLRHVISVGSVGQPRDYDHRACFVLYDSEAHTVEFKRVPYDVAASAQRIYDADLAVNFGKRLFLGV